jgi:hypothetical protein
LNFGDFRQICENGFGDRHNSYAHSMIWFKDHLYVGTTRSNLCMLKWTTQMLTGGLSNLEIWPVDCPDTLDGLYKLDRRAQIWRYCPLKQQWQQVFRSPMVFGTDGTEMSRDIGYRAIAVFQGESDPEPALYVGTWSAGRGPGPLVIRSLDGENFTIVSEYGIVGLPITTTRLLIPFKNRLFTSPTAAKGGKMNTSGVPVIYESRDPAKGKWQPVSLPGFGEDENLGTFSLCAFEDWLYAGTVNNQGFQIWRTDGTGDPPYKWEKVMEQGAYRGSLNQIAVSLQPFKGALYIGSGIQNGGYDLVNKIGPAAAELIRIFPDGQWDLIVGSPRKTPDGEKKPLSALSPGFGNLFNGYCWRMGVYDGWLYVGTYDASGFLPWTFVDKLQDPGRRLLPKVGIEKLVKNAGFELWRSWDGENWLPVNKKGFDNPYNTGIRNLVPTPYGLFVGTANAYGPRIAVREDDKWVYVDNPRGGCEVWQGLIDLSSKF